MGQGTGTLQEHLTGCAIIPPHDAGSIARMAVLAPGGSTDGNQ